MLTFWVCLAAAIGSVVRYLIDGAISARSVSDLPRGIFVVNVLGSFVLGLTMGLAIHRNWAGDTELIVGVGFAGGFTTWSTLMWDAVRIGGRKAAANLTLSLAAGLAAAGLGLTLAAKWPWG